MSSSKTSPTLSSGALASLVAYVSHSAYTDVRKWSHFSILQLWELTSSISPYESLVTYRIIANTSYWRGSTHHGINQLDAIIFRGVVTGSDHDTNPLSTQLSGAKPGKQAHGEDYGVEEITGNALVKV